MANINHTRDSSAPIITIAFADLTHTGQKVGANFFPFGVSIVAAHAKKTFGDKITIEIFKYPEKLSDYLSHTFPRVACFSNFLWNNRLSRAFAARIKELSPKTVIVFGGPNYPVDKSEQTAFLNRNPEADFYVYREGEEAFVGLFKALLEVDFDAESLKAQHRSIPGIHYLENGTFFEGAAPKRIQDLNKTPSPYLTGMCDKFFDNVLIPIIETNRGCPFSCTFCCEGSDFFKKVRWVNSDRTNAELDYIVERGKGPDILIADSNFGMFKEDLDTARKIAELQKTHDWPKYVLNSSGKNRKDRVMEVAKTLKGSLVVTSSIQSSDNTVLENIKRKNISLDEIIEVSKFSMQLGANSYSEVILAMPGDTLCAHMKSVNTLIDAGINYVMMYQMLMLPGTEAGTPESRTRFGMDTRFRVVPRSFGIYDIIGKTTPIAEIEEICVATNSLSFQDYLDCRIYNLTVEIFYNGGVFRELINFLKLNGVKTSEYIARVHRLVTESENPLSPLYADFIRENHERLWKDRESLEDFTSNTDILERFIAGELGSSEIYKYKTLIFFWRQEVLHDLAFAAARELLEETSVLDESISRYLEELDEFCLLRKDALHETDHKTIRRFKFDFISLAMSNFETNPLAFESKQGFSIKIYHDSDQRELIAQYRSQYGDTISGLGRLLSRTNVNTLYRKFEYSDEPL